LNNLLTITKYKNQKYNYNTLKQKLSKAEFFYMSSSYPNYKHTKSSETYTLCVALHPSSKAGAPFTVFAYNSSAFQVTIKLRMAIIIIISYFSVHLYDVSTLPNRHTHTKCVLLKNNEFSSCHVMAIQV